MIKYEKEPLLIETPVPNGNYEVTLTIKADCDTVYDVYSQNRRFIVQDREIKKGEEQEITFIANVSDIKYSNKDFKDNGVRIYIACDGDISAVSAVSPACVPTLYIIGDSTVTDQPAEYPYDMEKTFCGWGQMMPQLLDNSIAVSNHAESGSTTQATKDNNFTVIADKIKEDDYLMIEFGHNDQKVSELDAYGGYTENLKYFVNFAREKGATPILNSPINRIIFDEDGKIFNLLGEYRNAVKAVADKMNVPFIDMWTKTTDFFEPLGLYTSKKFFRHDEESQDYTHSNDIGGGIIARLCAKGIADAKINGLSDAVKTDMLEIEKPTVDPNAPKESNAHEFKRLKSIGMGSVPADLDDDISDLQNK